MDPLTIFSYVPAMGIVIFLIALVVVIAIVAKRRQQTQTQGQEIGHLSDKRVFPILITMIVLVVGLGVSLVLVRNQQETRSKAAQECHNETKSVCAEYQEECHDEQYSCQTCGAYEQVCQKVNKSCVVGEKDDGRPIYGTCEEEECHNGNCSFWENGSCTRNKCSPTSNCLRWENQTQQVCNEVTIQPPPSQPQNPYCSSSSNKDCIYGCNPTSDGGTCKNAPPSAPPASPPPASDPAGCCSGDSGCPSGQVCNVPNGACSTGKSCNDSVSGKFHQTCVNGVCVQMPGDGPNNCDACNWTPPSAVTDQGNHITHACLSNVTCNRNGCDATNNCTYAVKVCGGTYNCEGNTSGTCATQSWSQIAGDSSKCQDIPAKSSGHIGTTETTTCGSWQTDITVGGVSLNKGLASASGYDCTPTNGGPPPSGPTPTPTPPPSGPVCNQACTGTGQGNCPGGMQCLSGVCRNPSCAANADCRCGVPVVDAACNQVTADKVLSTLQIGDTVTFTGYGWVDKTIDSIDLINFIISKDGVEVSNTNVTAVRATEKDVAGYYYYKANKAYTISGIGSYSVKIRVHWVGGNVWKE